MRSALWAMVVVLGPATAAAGEWPAWRGPRGDGISDESGVPVRWSATENIHWKVPIPGKGHSSPIVWGDRVFVTTCIESDGKRLLLCLDRRTGKLLWERLVLTSKLEPKHYLNSYASSTPATDGKHVWVTFFDQPYYRIWCYDFDGKLVWEKSPGKFFSKHGFCSPPILYKDLVILNGDQDAEAYIVALDKTTGKEVWRADRPNRTRSYTPPVIIEHQGKKQLVLSGSLCVASYDPDTGKQIWIIDGPTEQYVASLVYSNDVLFMTYGYPKLGIMGIKPDGVGNVTKTHVLYDQPQGGGYVPSPIAHGDWFFNVSDKGIGSCREGKTGKLLWLERLGNHHSASPVSAGGHLYFPDDNGNTFVIKPGPEFQLICKNELGEETYGSPAISRGQIFIRGLNNLYCIAEPREKK